MSIVTKTGDAGTTGLMFNRRVSKCHPRVEAYGSVDELNAALGLARATTEHVEDLPRYVKDGYSLATPELTARLENLAREIEAQSITYKGWATPGANVSSAALDVARTTCRRAERRVCALHETDQLLNPEIIVFLNRLSDLLWLMARWAEAQNNDQARMTK